MVLKLFNAVFRVLFFIFEDQHQDEIVNRRPCVCLLTCIKMPLVYHQNVLILLETFTIVTNIMLNFLEQRPSSSKPFHEL